MTQGSDVPEAQDYLNQGMTLLYAFNHPEAIHSFNQAAKDDPKAAMPYWGIAMAAGPDINTGATYACLNLAYEAVKFAQNNAKTELEKEIANALAKRYIHRPYEESFRATDGNTENVKCVDKQNNKVNASSKQEKMCVHAPAYARAMKKLYNDKDLSPENKFDVATLYAAAEMNINPWKWWTQGELTSKIKELFDNLLEKSPSRLELYGNEPLSVARLEKKQTDS